MTYFLRNICRHLFYEKKEVILFLVVSIDTSVIKGDLKDNQDTDLDLLSFDLCVSLINQNKDISLPQGHWCCCRTC